MKIIKTTDELAELVLIDTENHSFKVLADLLLHAINDWPTINENKIENFISELKHFYSEEITIKTLSSKKIDFNDLHNSWRAESACYLIEMFEKAENTIDETNFDSIIFEILNYYSK